MGGAGGGGDIVEDDVAVVGLVCGVVVVANDVELKAGSSSRDEPLRVDVDGSLVVMLVVDVVVEEEDMERDWGRRSWLGFVLMVIVVWSPAVTSNVVWFREQEGRNTMVIQR